MGQSGSKSKRYQPQPYPLPPPGAFYPPAYPNFAPSYGQGQHMVVPYTYWPQDASRRRKKKRRNTTGGTTSRHDANQHSGLGRIPTVQRDSGPPRFNDTLFTPTTNGGERLTTFPSPNMNPFPRRTQTPYHRSVQPPEPDNESEPIVMPEPEPHYEQPSRHPADPPVVPGVGESESESDPDESGNEPEPEPVMPRFANQSSRRHHRRGQSEPRNSGLATSSAFDRPLWTPSNNPLPLPPRDLFASDAYKNHLDLTRSSDLFTALYGYQRNVVQEPGQQLPQRSKTGLFGRKTSTSGGGGGGGLLRSLTGSRKHREEDPKERIRAGDVRLVPFPVAVPGLTATAATTFGVGTRGSVGVAQQPAMNLGAPPSSNAPVVLPTVAVGSAPGQQVPNAPFPVLTTTQQPNQTQFMPTPAPAPAPNTSAPASTSASPPLYFTQQDSQYQGFFPHSPHRVLFSNQTYPTATHLHEALKYLPRQPQAAEEIRLCTNLADVYPLSAKWQEQGATREDWGSVFLKVMEDVLVQKFKQHPDLRDILLSTGDKGIVYSDERDRFWGDGVGREGAAAAVGRGANELGKVLVRVREKLKAEGY